MKQRCHSSQQALTFEPVRVSEHIESCRAHVASLSGLAHIASQALDEFIEYESDEPHLGTCMEVVNQLLDHVVRRLLDQVQAALLPLGVISHDVDPQTRGIQIAAGCEEQRQVLDRARHITLATIYILKSSGVDQSTGDITESLRDLEEGLRTVIDGLHPATISLSLDRSEAERGGAGTPTRPNQNRTNKVR